MKSIHRIGAIALAGIALAITSCSTGGRSPSGFLSDYSQLNAGYGTADAVSAYVRPGVDFKRYDSVMIDPVTTVVAASGISPEVSAQLAKYLGDALRENAPASMKVVSVPGPTTLRVRAALTDVIEGGPTKAPVKSVHPSPQAAMTGTLGSDAVAAFVSNVSFEGEILDSATGVRLSAMCDHRIGVKREASAATSWAAVRSATQQGALRLWKRFEAARAQ